MLNTMMENENKSFTNISISFLISGCQIMVFWSWSQEKDQSKISAKYLISFFIIQQHLIIGFNIMFPAVFKIKSDKTIIQKQSSGSVL